MAFVSFLLKLQKLGKPGQMQICHLDFLVSTWRLLFFDGAVLYGSFPLTRAINPYSAVFLLMVCSQKVELI